MESGTSKVRRYFRRMALSQKINFIFGVFFLVAVIQHLIDYREFTTWFSLVSFPLALGLFALSFVDNVVIRFTQVGILLGLGFLLLWVNQNPGNLNAFILLSIALIAAYKMSLFGRNTGAAIKTIIFLSIVVAFISGTLHEFTFMQRVNVVNFIIAYMALLFVIFEEETLSLRRQHQALTRRADEMRPFAALGTNIAGLVHDFKGDVAGLYAIASIEEYSDNTETAQRVQSFADRINERVESILDVATADKHQEPDIIDISRLLHHVVYYFVEINRDLKHQVTINLEAEPELTVIARRNALMVVLENVIKNSIEATTGYAQREVTVAASRESSERVVITVSHTGRHLPEKLGSAGPVDVRRSVYFKQGRSEKPGGTGLGMINTIRALELLDAEMTMTDRPVGVESRIILTAVANAAGEESEN